MYSTTTLVKNSKFSGKIVGTHQRMDQAARLSLAKVLAKNKYFPSSKEIIHFEGSRGPDGLKRKSPGIDEPSHMLVLAERQAENLQPAKKTTEILDGMMTGVTDVSVKTSRMASAELEESFIIQPAAQPASDPRTVLEQINDHRYNLVQALKTKNSTRAAFEAAWLAHMITDGLTPAHHFPLSEVKEELMTDKDLVKVFGEPIKGVMHGRNTLETMRNNWLYWGMGGHMSKHVAFEYGALMLSTAMTPKTLQVNLSKEDLQELDTEKMFRAALQRVFARKMYTRFLEKGWTTDLAMEVRDFLFPEIVRAIALGWYSAASEAYGFTRKKKNESAKK